MKENGGDIILWVSQDWSRVLRLPDHNTAQYSVVLDRQGDVVLGIGDMEIHEQITSEYVCITSRCAIEGSKRSRSATLLTKNYTLFPVFSTLV